MGRIKGIKNKNSETPIKTCTLSSEERICFLANLIIDQMIQDQKNELPLFKRLSIK